MSCAVSIEVGGETFVPVLKSSTMADLWYAFNEYHDGNLAYTVTGIRPGEKMHEEMISEVESANSVFAGDTYIIYPTEMGWDREYKIPYDPMTHESYGSRYADKFTQAELLEMVKKFHQWS